MLCSILFLVFGCETAEKGEAKYRSQNMGQTHEKNNARINRELAREEEK